MQKVRTLLELVSPSNTDLRFRCGFQSSLRSSCSNTRQRSSSHRESRSRCYDGLHRRSVFHWLELSANPALCSHARSHWSCLWGTYQYASRCLFVARCLFVVFCLWALMLNDPFKFIVLICEGGCSVLHEEVDDIACFLLRYPGYTVMGTPSKPWCF